jgi:hypothetical protein
MPKKAKTDPKIAYQYRPNGDERCGNCTMFRAPNSCTDVAGTIVRQGWCKIWSARKEK